MNEIWKNKIKDSFGKITQNSHGIAAWAIGGVVIIALGDMIFGNKNAVRLHYKDADFHFAPSDKNLMDDTTIQTIDESPDSEECDYQ